MAVAFLQSQALAAAADSANSSDSATSIGRVETPPEGLPNGSVVTYDVKIVQQTSPMSCWAAVYTMMRSWREGRSFAISEAVATLGAPYPTYLTQDDGLPGGAEQDLVTRAGMHALPPASYPLSTIRNLLRAKGPLWITAGDGVSAHARLLVGIFSFDESETAATYQQSWMKFIDPQDGTFRYQTALEFEELFEREAAFVVQGRMDNIPLRWQIISY